MIKIIKIIINNKIINNNKDNNKDNNKIKLY